MRCVGYRQAWEALDGQRPISALRERGIAATRQLAKRQITWLRSMPARHRLAADAPDAVAQSIALARALAQRLAPAPAAPRDASAAPA
jgi:tRNA dimethylallyltransferase